MLFFLSRRVFSESNAACLHPVKKFIRYPFRIRPQVFLSTYGYPTHPSEHMRKHMKSAYLYPPCSHIQTIPVREDTRSTPWEAHHFSMPSATRTVV